jgi:hypothetical protein
MKKIALLLIMMALAAPMLHAQQGVNENDAKIENNETGAKDSAGLDFSLSYYSKYIWRGWDVYQGDGYFYPAVVWSIFKSGFNIAVGAEVPASWVFNGFAPLKKKYYLNDMDFSGGFHTKKKKINNYAYANMGLDFSAGYNHTFDGILTFGAGIWYVWYYNSKEAREMAWLKIESLNVVEKIDVSYFSVGASVILDCVPWINPKIAAFYDNYPGYRRAGDYYLLLGINHVFELVKDTVSITPSLTAGYYWGRTWGYDNYYVASLNGFDCDLTPVSAGGDDFLWRQHAAPRKGVSDIVPSVTLTVSKGGFYVIPGFFWVIVPARSWHKGYDVHRYYAQVCVGYSL